MYIWHSIWQLETTPLLRQLFSRSTGGTVVIMSTDSQVRAPAEATTRYKYDISSDLVHGTTSGTKRSLVIVEKQRLTMRHLTHVIGGAPC